MSEPRISDVLNSDVGCRATRVGFSSPSGDPVDCDWPYCGCDKEADRVIAGLQECGWVSPHDLDSDLAQLRAELTAYKAEHAQLAVALQVCSDVVMLTSAVGGHYAPISQDDWNRALGLAALARQLPLAAAVLASQREPA